MPTWLHSHFSISERARDALLRMAYEYRSAGFQPELVSIAWATVNLRAGGSYQAPFISYYCAGDKHGFPDDEIGYVDGVKCVFFLLDHMKEFFKDRTLDWGPETLWILRPEPGKPYMPPKKGIQLGGSPVPLHRITTQPANDDGKPQGLRRPADRRVLAGAVAARPTAAASGPRA